MFYEIFIYYCQVKNFIKKEVSNRVNESASLPEKSTLKLNGHLTEKEKLQAVCY